ncbi:MAG: ABC transporter permease subunit [Phycisphaeraceae bacterium]|nr:ABC transporter permease subunit [Phycisphaeraceae bacterium]
MTLKLCGIAWLIGFPLGIGFGLAGARWPRSAGRVLQAIAVLFAAVPVLVVLFWLHYPAQAMLGMVIDPFLTATVTLMAYTAILVADAVRLGLGDFPAQFDVAAKVCGLRHSQILLRIKLPLMFRRLLPTALSIIVVILQASLFASLISVNEIFRVAQRINSMVYKPVELFTALALFFVVVCVPLHIAAIVLRYRYTRDVSER